MIHHTGTCKVCRRPIDYAGSGRPRTSHPECRRALRADDKRVERLRAANPDAAEPAGRYWALPETSGLRFATVADVAPSFSDPGDDVDLGLTAVTLARGGTRWATDAHTTPRTRDAAEKWLAAHHPEALADFPAAL